MQQKDKQRKIKPQNALRLKIGVIVSDYYSEEVTNNLLTGALGVLKEWHVPNKNVTVVRVLGSFEIPYACLTLLKKKKFDALIALGCIIKGETNHDQYITTAVMQGIMDLIVFHNVPIGLGVLSVNTMAQAKARSSGKDNKGRDAAIAALHSALI